ncbi:MAG: hypothetical protein WCQ48_08275 [Chloroflexota bacterium]
MRILLLALIVLLTFVGCANVRAKSPPSTTPTSTTPTPTATPTPALPVPVRAWTTPPPTGVAMLDEVVLAISRRDAAALAPYITGREVTCDGG